MQTVEFGDGIVELGLQWVLRADLDVPEEMEHPLLEIVRRCDILIPSGGRGMVSYNSRGENISPDVGAGAASSCGS